MARASPTRTGLRARRDRMVIALKRAATFRTAGLVSLAPVIPVAALAVTALIYIADDGRSVAEVFAWVGAIVGAVVIVLAVVLARLATAETANRRGHADLLIRLAALEKRNRRSSATTGRRAEQGWRVRRGRRHPAHDRRLPPCGVTGVGAGQRLHRHVDGAASRGRVVADRRQPGPHAPGGRVRPRADLRIRVAETRRAAEGTGSGTRHAGREAIQHRRAVDYLGRAARRQRLSRREVGRAPCAGETC